MSVNNNNKNIKKKESKSQNKDIISGINIFNNLLSNKAFRKFLNHKLINDKDNEDNPQINCLSNYMQINLLILLFGVLFGLN